MTSAAAELYISFISVRIDRRGGPSPFLSAILPAFNEAGSIRRSLAAMRTFLNAQDYTYEVIVAADGDDATPAIVTEMAHDWPNLRLSAEHGRHGKGHGLRRGMALAQGEIVGFLDADYKTEIDEVARFLPWFEQGYDIVAGSRALADSHIERYQPRYRQVGSRLFGLAMHAIVGLTEIPDTQCGFKFFSRQAAQAIFERTRIDGYMCDVEILVLAKRLGLRIKQLGVNWRDDGDSRLALVTGNLRNGADLFAIRFGRYTALPAVLPASAAHPGTPVQSES